MCTMAAQEVKRRGMSAMNDSLKNGPVWVIANNQPKYVVMLTADYSRMEEEITALRVALSEADVKAERVRRGTAKELVDDIFEA